MISLYFIALLILLITIAVIDRRTSLIPDELNLALAIFGLVFSYGQGIAQFKEAILGALLGFALTITIRIIYKFWRGFNGLGLGDVKMIAAGGCWVGVDGIALVLLIAAISGIFADLAFRYFFSASTDRYRKLPFGPYLAVGILTTWMIKFTAFSDWLI